MKQNNGKSAVGGKTPKAVEPSVVESSAVLKAQGNMLILVCLLLVLLCAGLAFSAINSANRRADEVRVAFVKLHPNGSYNVSFYDSEQPFSLFQNTIDQLLRKAVVSRYKRDPATITNDHNYFALFLGTTELTKYLSEYRATQVVRDYLACTDCQLVHPMFRGLHHIDRNNINLSDISAGVNVRSTMFLDMEIRSRNTGALIRVEKKIVNLLWTIDTTKINPTNNIQDLSMVILNENPIGLTILEYSIDDDLSQTGSGVR
jgi:hypothetical protein